MSVAHYFDTMDYGPAFESDSDVRAWLLRHADGFGHFIGGRFTPLAGGTRVETTEPATGKPLARIAQGSAADVDAAVEAARSAQPAWLALGGHARARHLYAMARMMQRHARLLAVLQALNGGRAMHSVRDADVPLVARLLYHHAGWAQLQEREFADSVPLGVIGQIFPAGAWLSTLARAIAPALALGNTVVLKPSNATPLGALLFAELATDAGLPAGVLNVVTGDAATGAALVSHEGVDKIAFSGSAEVGRLVRQATAGTGKSLSLSLGGPHQIIVFEDADLDAAVEGVVELVGASGASEASHASSASAASAASEAAASHHRSADHAALSTPRLLLQEGIAAEFHQRLSRRMKTLRVGMPLDKTVDVSAPLHHGDANGTSPSKHDEPLVETMTFRTPDEAVALADNTRWGLAASVWSETLERAVGVATQLQTGTVWINATHLVDAGVGVGGWRESGFGTEGGRDGCHDHLQPRAWAQRKLRAARIDHPATQSTDEQQSPTRAPAIDRTAKLFIGGKQTRPDSDASMPVFTATGLRAGEVGAGTRKDIRNAVTAARAAAAWSSATAHRRAQALYYLAENLSARADEFTARIASLTGAATSAARAEVEASIDRLFTYGAWADKFEGGVQAPVSRTIAMTVVAPLGVVGMVCPDNAPLLSLVSLLAPLMAMGNRTVIVPGERHALVATDFCQVLESSDLPAGVVNVVTGRADALLRTLAEHDDVDGLWAFGDAARSHSAEALSVGNLKRTFVDHGLAIDWHDAATAEGPLYLRQATRVKNIWLPHGA